MAQDPTQMSQIHTHDMIELSLRSHSQDGQMHNSLGTPDGREADLLLKSSQTIRQMAEIVQSTGVNKEEEIFCSHLMLNSMIFQYCLTREPEILSRLNRDSIDDALRHLGSLIPETGVHELPPRTTLKFRLKALSDHWRMQAESHDAKVDFVRRWLKLGSPVEHLNRVDRGLGECAKMLQKQLSEKTFEKTHHKSVSTSSYEPSHVVWKAAQALYDALQRCQGCSCSTQHEFRAKLELGTYRQSLKSTENNSISRFNSSRMLCSDGSATGKLDFEMFLSVEHDWHEVRVQTVKERFVGFEMDGRATSSRQVREAKRMEQICKSIDTMRPKAWQRLVLKLRSGQLFQERVEKSNFWVNKSIEPISLLRCLEESDFIFSEKTKRILSLIIGYGVFHLEGTRWLQLGWGSANIKFFRTSTNKTPLRPFIQVDMPEVSEGGDIGNEKKHNDDAGFDLDSGHPCPALIALAVVLIEIHFAKPFSKLAQMIGIPLENPSERITLLDVDQVFNGEEENKVEGWRSHIPEDSSHLLMAIDNCLNPENWEDEEGNPLDDEPLKSRIYRDVIRFLELNLGSGFSDLSLDNLDNYARHLDFRGIRQAIDGQELRANTSTLFQVPPTSHSVPLPAATLLEPARFRALFDLPEVQKLLHQCSQTSALVSLSSSLMNLSSLTNCQTEYRVSHFFDDQVDDEGLSISK